MQHQIKFDKLPQGKASNIIIPGCLVIEGGAFRGIYAQGVTDYLMQHDINMACTIGCSAGAMTGMNYVSGQIGRSVLINLKYRHDSRYVGWKALKQNKGLIGFDFVLEGINQYYPFDEKRFLDKNRRFIAVATDINTGKAHYFDKEQTPHYLKAVQASASMPIVSRPVLLNNSLFLDGGCSDSIPYQWAIDQGYKKIIVIRTRESTYKKPLDKNHWLLNHSRLAKKYPLLCRKLESRSRRYNQQCDELDKLIKDKNIFCIAPSKNVDVGRLEKDCTKLEKLYWSGYKDTEKIFSKLTSYLK